MHIAKHVQPQPTMEALAYPTLKPAACGIPSELALYSPVEDVADAATHASDLFVAILIMTLTRESVPLGGVTPAAVRVLCRSAKVSAHPEAKGRRCD